jgi:hypothetical protein
MVKTILLHVKYYWCNFYQELCKFALQINSALRFKVLNAVWCTHNIF